MDSTNSILATQLAFAAVFGWAVQWAKTTPLVSFMTVESTKVNHAIGALLAAAATVGITATWTAETHTLAITGLTLHALWLLAWNFVKQYAFQHSASTLFKLVEEVDKIRTVIGAPKA